MIGSMKGRYHINMNGGSNNVYKVKDDYSWEATYFDVNAKDQMALAEKAAKMGIEFFVVDDGWFEIMIVQV
jgi:hypothetical protein